MSIVQLFLIVAKMAKSSKSWLKEFVENMIVEYCSGTSRRDSVAEEILKAVVKKCPLSFAMELPELACESAETLWGQRVSRKHFKYELKRNWTNDSIDYWNALRELCLMRPTLSRKNVEQNSQYQLVYICAPGEITTYSYEQEGDYNKNINIKFDGSLPQKMSEDEVHLKEIMQIPGVKALFEKHGYATSFVPNEFILTPPMFNNIYKGALGEVVGKYILEQYAGVTLQEMPPEFFELFDYTLGNGVYVDFKLWKETMLISAEEEKKNVLEKLDKCGGKRAVIINIMLDRNMQITSKKNMGKDVSNEIVEFSGLEDTEISLITKDAVVKRIRKAKAEVVEKVHTDVTEELDVVTEEDLPQKKTDNIPEWPDGILDYLDETERNKVLEYACNLQISQSTRLHKMLVQYKKDIADYKSKLKEVQSRPYYNSRHNKPENEPEFFKEMSDECMSRAIAILDTVFKTIESLGGSINSDLSVKIRGDIVRFCMVESQDQVKHEMTKQEAQALVKYNDDIKNHRWASKPQIRKYDKVYNGKLRIVFGARSYIRDNDSEKLEDRLGDILVTLYEKAEENRIVREAREEAERKRVEEERRREENRQRKEQEIRLVKELVNKAEDYRIAKEIREYIQAMMIDSGNEDITPEWIEWALKKADWYDPSIATEDEYLGKRQHEKSAEEKEKSLQDSIRKSWYW